METSSQNLTIMHYNDVYNVESREKPEPIGGAARMLTAFKQFSHLNSFTFLMFHFQAD